MFNDREMNCGPSDRLDRLGPLQHSSLNPQHRSVCSGALTAPKMAQVILFWKQTQHPVWFHLLVRKHKRFSPTLPRPFKFNCAQTIIFTALEFQPCEQHLVPYLIPSREKDNGSNEIRKKNRIIQTMFFLCYRSPSTPP